MPTAFPSPQFPLLPDAVGPRYYANVDNRMEVCKDSRIHRVAVEVPTGLFTIMRDVFKIPPEVDVYLAIDENDERYVFSLMYGDELRDLWDYSEGSVPSWIFDRGYQL